MAAVPGGALSRQHSSSHITPRSLMGYQTFFRQNSVPEAGWLEVRLDKSETWERLWVVFGSGELSYAPTMDGPKLARIPMEKVVSFRTDNASSGTSIIVTTTEIRLYLRASNKEEMKGWLFSFQLSVALVLSHLIENKNSGSDARGRASLHAPGDHHPRNLSQDGESGQPGGWSRAAFGPIPEGDEVSAFTRQGSDILSPDALRRLSHRAGGGVGTGLIRRPSYTDADIDSAAAVGSEAGLLWERSRSTRDLMRHDSTGTASQTASMWSSAFSSKGTAPIPLGLAMSPAIPISNMGHRQPPAGPRLAGSYEGDAQRAPHLEQAIQVLDLQEDREPSEDGSEGSQQGGSDEDDEGLLLFDLEESPNPRNSNANTNSNVNAIGNGNGNGNSNSSSVGSGSRRASRSSSHASSLPRYSPSLLQGLSAASMGISWVCGHCSKLGPRSSNEDRLVALPDLVACGSAWDSNATSAATTSSSSSSPSSSSSSSSAAAAVAASPPPKTAPGFLPATNYAYFAVYDGHCGQQASTFLKDVLHERICRHPSFLSDLPKAITEACVQADKDFLALCVEKRMYCGSTALGAFLCGPQLVVFSIGDCQAVLCSGGTAVDLGSPHQPGRPDEADRIAKAGGWITEEKELYMGRLHRMDLSDPVVRDAAQQVNWTTINRVCGELAVSRSIGDPDYKNFIPGEKVQAPFNWPDGHDQIFMADLVIPLPELTSHALTARDEFFLIASDGLWDVVSRAEAVARTRLLLSQNKSPDEAAEELCDLALKLGSSDNVSIVICLFVHP